MIFDIFTRYSKKVGDFEIYFKFLILLIFQRNLSLLKIRLFNNEYVVYPFLIDHHFFDTFLLNSRITYSNKS